MTVAELLSNGLDGFVSEKHDPSEETRRALTRAAYVAMAHGDRAGFRTAQAQLRLVSSNASSDIAYELNATDAQELNALVQIPDVPSEIDWDSVYDDPDV